MKPGGRYSDPIPFTQFLSSNGDGTGIINAILDYATTPGTVYIQPSADEIMVIQDLLIHVVDSGALPEGSYAGLGVSLANGIDIQVTNEGSSARSVIPGLIKSNGELSHVSGTGRFDIINFSGGVDGLSSVIDFGKAGLILDGSQGHKLEVLFTDSLVGLVDHHFIAHGTK